MISLFTKRYLYLVFTWLVLSCNSYIVQSQEYIEDISVLVNKTHAERTILLMPFYEKGIRNLDSTKVFSIIKKIKQLAIENNDNALLQETELMRLHYFVYKDYDTSDYTNKEFVTKEILKLNALAKSENMLWLEIRTYSHLANYLYQFHHDYGLGFEYYERTAELLENVSAEEFPLKQICLYQLAYAYNQFKEYDNGITYYIKAKDTKSPLHSYYYEMHIFNSLGNSYRKIEKLDSSFFYFNITLEKALQAKDTVWEGISSGNIGQNYLLEGQLDKAQPLLELDAKIAMANNDWGLASNAFAFLSEIQLKKTNLAEADSLINRASYYAHKSNQYKRLPKLFTLQSKIAAYQSNPERASIYLDSTFLVKDSIAKLFDARKLLRAKQRIEIEKLNFEEEKAQAVNSKQLWIRNLVIVGLGLLILIAILFYNRKQLRTQVKEQLLASEKKLTLQKLESATKNLEIFKQSILKKNKIIEQLENQINPTGSTDQAQYTSQERLVKAALLTDKDWREFVLLFEQVNTGFFMRLKQTYPNLTPSEIRLITLSRLQLGNKEMALMLGVGPDAIRQTRSRLRRKINLQKETTLQKVALGI